MARNEEEDIGHSIDEEDALVSEGTESIRGGDSMVLSYA